MTNNEAARQYARDGRELGELKNRYAPTLSPAQQAQALIDTMDAAKLTGNKAAFLAAQSELRALVEVL